MTTITLTIILSWIAVTESDNVNRKIGRSGEVSKYQLSALAIKEVNRIYRTKYTKAQIKSNENLAGRFCFFYLGIIKDRYELKHGVELDYRNIKHLQIIIQCYNAGNNGYKSVKGKRYWREFIRDNEREIKKYYNLKDIS